MGNLVIHFQDYEYIGMRVGIETSFIVIELMGLKSEMR